MDLVKAIAASIAKSLVSEWSKVKFGILSQWYDPEPGSAAIPGVLARGLRARGHDIQVVTGFPNYPTGRLAPGYHVRPRTDERTADGIRIRRVAVYPSHDRSSWRRAANYGSFALSATAAALPAMRRSDAIWVYNSPATVGMPSWLASTVGGPPHLMHVVDLWPDSIGYSGLVNPGKYERLEPLIGRWCRFTYRQAAAVAGISQGICDELVARGVPGAKVHHIPVWTDEERHRPRPRDEALAAELGLRDEFVVLYAGNLGEAQGLDNLLEVCARITDLVGFRCLIAGSGTAETRLRAKAADMRLTNTTFLGRWPATEVDRLMSIGDVHIVSLAEHPLTELTFPSKLPSTLASGRAVLASATGETARVVQDSGAGWVVHPGDTAAYEAALREAHSLGRDGVAKLGVAGRRYYEDRLSMQGGVTAVEEVLVELAARRSARSGV